ncbi:hypothetical protein SAMN02745157_1542 [Kaistia soli DSM 19436]|uniref:Uncharacterized protein n=1 Tax=Kaistia soli DSM 19436 TaxID=1122133 RepID=A0A1M4YK48_9HYPH|nr:hypothetical protein [Kaistia soli]SHF06038.1 hypothetical protein SAMN02745157_1542 [Kaistia soli DSM 19436]
MANTRVFRSPNALQSTTGLVRIGKHPILSYGINPAAFLFCKDFSRQEVINQSAIPIINAPIGDLSDTGTPTGLLKTDTLARSGGGKLTGILTAGALTSVTIDNGGGSYSSAPRVYVYGDGTGAAVTAIVTAGVITGYTITNPGSGYTFIDLYVAGARIIAGKGLQIGDNQSTRVQVDTGAQLFQANLGHDYYVAAHVTVPSKTDATNPNIISKMAGNGNGTAGIYLSWGPSTGGRIDGKFSGYTGGNGDIGLASITGVGAPDNAPHHLAIAIEGGFPKVYKDNTLRAVGASVAATPLTALTQEMVIGNRGGVIGFTGHAGMVVHLSYTVDLTVAGITAAQMNAIDLAAQRAGSLTWLAA